MTPENIAQLFARLAAANPEPQTELIHHNPYTLLVAVVLSAQATDASVNRATAALFAQADTPAAMLRLGEENLKAAIRSLNYNATKARNVIRLSEILLHAHDGLVPHNREALEALPGVGRKTANVVLNVVFGEPTIAVDTHIFRVANRTGIAPGNTPLAVEQELLRVVPDPWRLHAHHWLILHGRYVCKARRPECAACRIADLCAFPGRTPAAATGISEPTVTAPPPDKADAPPEKRRRKRNKAVSVA